jgi:DNA repair protein RadA/Sms
MAVLERRCGLGLGNCDAYINIAGGIRMNEPAVDLAIVLAIASSYKDVTIGDKVIAFGEVGLSGEVRAVSRAELRVREAGKLGFDTAIVPSANMRQLKQIEGIRLVPVASVREAIQYILKS